MLFYFTEPFVTNEGKSMTDEHFNTKRLILEDLNGEQRRVLDPFAKEIDQYFKSEQLGIPQKIYHYTTATKASSILRSREIWLFSVFNPASENNSGAGAIDQGEVISGLRIISDECNSIFKSHQMRCFHAFAEMIEETLNSRYRDFASIFIFCVAAAPNQYLWEQAEKRGEPACLQFSDRLFAELCDCPEERDNAQSSGRYFSCIICYDENVLRTRVRPFCKSAAATLGRAVKESRGDGRFVWSVMCRLSMQLSLPFLKEAYAYKSPKYSVENEIRLLKIFPCGFEVRGQTKYYDRNRIIEPIQHHLPFILISDHGELTRG
jgi:hypothetical protein